MIRTAALFVAAACLILTALVVARGEASESSPRSRVLFENVRVFDGRASSLTGVRNVLVEGNRIAKVSDTPISASNATVIDGEGRTLMPGLIDAHVHLTLEGIPQVAALTTDVGYMHAMAVRSARRQLLRGFTTVRDAGGPTFGLKRAIDEGALVGPRIYPSGAMISQTGGHGDFGLYMDVPRVMGALSPIERSGLAIIADGPDAVLMRVREQLRQGASQVKLLAGGGISSSYDPIDVTEYTEQELRAAVTAADNWGTYVTVHAYTPHAIQMAVRAGVRCIEHGQLIDKATAKMLAKNDVWLSLQPFVDDEDANPKPPAYREKQLEVYRGTDQAYALAKRYGIKTAFGTDTLFAPTLADRQGKKLAKLVRWYSPAEVLSMATAGNAELLAMSGRRNPYPGPLGVVEEGALADLILVDGNPLENIELVANPEESFVVIMKDGVVYKSTIMHESR